MEQGKLSVIMSVYNEKEVWLKESLESVLRQTYSNFEFIIVLDNPEQTELEKIIKEYAEKDPRIIFIKNKRNFGLVYSLNEALEVAKGEFIGRMDADDISEPERFEIEIDALLKKNLDVVGGRITYINENDEYIGLSTSYGLSEETCKKSLGLRNIISHPTWLVRKSVFDDIGKYNDVYAAEDYEWLCRASSNGFQISNIDDVILKYRLRRNSICSVHAYQQNLVESLIRNEFNSSLKNNVPFSYKAIEKKLKAIDYSKEHKVFVWSTKVYKNGCERLKKRKIFTGICLIFVSIIVSPKHLKHFIRTIKLRSIHE